jgi:hypothetical protein
VLKAVGLVARQTCGKRLAGEMMRLWLASCQKCHGALSAEVHLLCATDTILSQILMGQISGNFCDSGGDVLIQLGNGCSVSLESLDRRLACICASICAEDNPRDEFWRICSACSRVNGLSSAEIIDRMYDPNWRRHPSLHEVRLRCPRLLIMTLAKYSWRIACPSSGVTPAAKPHVVPANRQSNRYCSNLGPCS